MLPDLGTSTGAAGRDPGTVKGSIMWNKRGHIMERGGLKGGSEVERASETEPHHDPR